MKDYIWHQTVLKHAIFWFSWFKYLVYSQGNIPKSSVDLKKKKKQQITINFNLIESSWCISN